MIAKNQEPVKLHKGDAYVIPPDMKYAVSALSENLEILEVSLPGSYNTSHHYMRSQVFNSVRFIEIYIL